MKLKQEWLWIALLAFVVLAAPPALMAQGCVSCKDNASAAPASLQQGLRDGILVLLLPAGGGFGLFAIWLLRRARTESAANAPLPPRV